MSASVSRDDALSIAVATLLRGPVYAEEDGVAWAAIINQAGRLHDHLRLMGMRMIVDDGEEYAYLRALDELPDGMPRLMRRHRLTFSATVLLVLLRQRMTAAEAEEASPRLIVTTGEVVEMMRIYHRPGIPEERIAADIGRLEDLGYVKKLRGSTDTFEARRIIKAQVTAEWLASYADELMRSAPGIASSTEPDSDVPVIAGDEDGNDV